MAGEVERGGEPAASRHIELAAAAPPDFRHGPLKSLGVHGNAIPHRPEIGEIEDKRAEAGNGAGWRAPEAIEGCPLPRDDENETEGPDESQQSAVEGKKLRDPLKQSAAGIGSERGGA